MNQLQKRIYRLSTLGYCPRSFFHLEINTGVRRLLVLSVLFVVPFFLTVTAARADEGGAQLYSAQGTVEIQRTGAAVWQVAARNDFLNPGDTVRTGSESRAGIALEDGSLVRLGPVSSLTIEAKTVTSKETLLLEHGKLFFYSRSDDHSPEIHTPVVSAAIRGTEIVVEADDSKTSVAVLDGKIECFNSFGSVPAKKGELVTTLRGAAPTKVALVRPRDYVQWALNVPPLDIDNERTDKGNYLELHKELILISDLLSSGDVDGAERHVNEMASRQPGFALVASLQSIIAILRDDKETAFARAKEALKGQPTSHMAHLAMSYALQSKGDLTQARKTLEEDGEPSSPFYLARRAELSLALDDKSAARKDAEASVALAKSTGANSPYGLTVLGFLEIIEGHSTVARDLFTQAIGLGDSYPVAYLGRGLALTQMGNPQQGTKDIMTAVHLAPTTAVFRSYLGKALFELERPSAAHLEFDRAIALDPNDPTPFLYRSFERLAANDPVGALDDLSQSSQLNDNRAVYRSSLLLDQDLAVRKASLAEVFSALGFDEIGRVQALSSLTDDYSNFSAHRYLANTYTRNYQTEAGRSERALANVLSPLGFNTLQPLGENSFGEYTSLFERNEERTAIASSLDSKRQEVAASVTQSGRSNEFGYFLNASGYYNDFAPGLPQDKNGLFSSALQYQPTTDFKLFALTEVQGRQIKGFQSELGAQEDEIRRSAGTTGATLHLSPSVTAFSVVSYQHNNNSIQEPTVAAIQLEGTNDDGAYNTSDLANVFDRTKQKPDQFQLTDQILVGTRLVTAAIGHELFVTHVERSSKTRIIHDQLGLDSVFQEDLQSDENTTLQNHSIFTYTTWHIFPTLDVSLSGAYSMVESEDRFTTPYSPSSTSSERFNPKGGLTWRPKKWATVRAAYVESLERTVLEGLPSYEPSVVGAVNQRYSDLPDTFSRNSTIGIDLVPLTGSYVGVEATHRDLKLLDISPTNYNVDLNGEPPYGNSILGGSRADVFRDVNLVSSYWYQVLTTNLVSSTEYRYSLDNTTDPDLAFRVETHRGIVGLRAFESNGFFVRGLATYIDQDRSEGLPEENGHSNGLLLDAGVGYRLPSRHGIIELRVNNLLDKDLNLEPLLELDSTYQSGIGAVLGATFNF